MDQKTNSHTNLLTSVILGKSEQQSNGNYLPMGIKSIKRLKRYFLSLNVNVYDEYDTANKTNYIHTRCHSNQYKENKRE